MHKILIYRIGSIGDTIVSLPAMHLIREKHAGEEIILLSNLPIDQGIKAAPSSSVLVNTGLIDFYIDYPVNNLTFKTIIKLIWKIRSKKISKMYYLMPKRKFIQRLRDKLFFKLAGIKFINGLYILINSAHNNLIMSNGLYESEARRLVRSIGFESGAISHDLFSLNLSTNEINFAGNFIKNNNISLPFIAINLGGKDPVKNWGEKNWISLIEQLSQFSMKYSLLFFGSHDERVKCNKVVDKWPGLAYNACGLLEPRQSAAVMKMANLFIGQDSGPMHLANSVGIPCISIFSSKANPGVWFPFNNEKNIFYTKVPCSNCGLNICIEKKAICIKSITPKMVATRIYQLLDEMEKI